MKKKPSADFSWLLPFLPMEGKEIKYRISVHKGPLFYSCRQMSEYVSFFRKNRVSSCLEMNCYSTETPGKLLFKVSIGLENCAKFEEFLKGIVSLEEL